MIGAIFIGHNFQTVDNLIKHKHEFLPPYQCNDLFHFHIGLFILVTNGNGNRANLLDKTEILDLKNPKFQCSGPDFPVGMCGGGGGIVKGVPLICGGLTLIENAWRIFDHCYKLTHGKWQKIRSLKNPIYALGSGHVVIRDKLLMNGGVTSKTGLFKDWEFTYASNLIGLNSNERLADLPFNLTGHCNILINDTTLLITGGYGGFDHVYSNETHFYNIENQSWTKGPYLNQARTYHGCMKTFVGNKTILLVTGGIIKHNQEDLVYTNSIEYLDLHSNNLTWKSGKITLIFESRTCLIQTFQITTFPFYQKP